MEEKNIIVSVNNEIKTGIELKYTSSKFVFIITTLLFFSSFFLYWVGMKYEILESLMGIFYILFVISLLVYIFFLCRKFLKISLTLSIILAVLLLLLSMFLLLPMVVKGGVYSLINNL
jgi:ABC-type multidrug transport system permease subunit